LCTHSSLKTIKSGMASSKPSNAKDDEESDQLMIKPLGAGQEVGRSCHILEFKGKKLMLDCGIHPGMQGLDTLPYVDQVDLEEIDLLLVTHFHLDHCGALPWLLEKTVFKGRVFMTHATKAIYRWLLSDYIRVSSIGTTMLYNEKDLENTMSKIETINFHQEMEVNGVKFWAYTAGHVLGAAMFMIEIAGVKVMYTGDFSRQEDRHLMAAEIPVNVQPDVLIVESTYGTHIHEPREEREGRFTSIVHDIVNRGGRCLIPVFALGRAQELLLILDEYWAMHPELQDVPIYYASSLAKKCMSVYQTYINAMNDKIKRQINVSNPFVFKHISNLKSMDHFDDIGPSVVMASPGMMQTGLSRELFENWCTDRRNGVIIAGYCVEGTLAKFILSEPEEITSMSGQKLKLNCSVEYISFSAHTDYKQTSEFIKALKPAHVVLVHGEATEMNRLKQALIREYENDPHDLKVYNPKNTQEVQLMFRGEKMAKVMGSLASKRTAEEGEEMSGILVKRNFNYHILSPEDLPNYTELSLSSVTQRQSLVLSANPVQLGSILAALSGGDAVKIDSQEEKTQLLKSHVSASSNANTPAHVWRVFKSVTVIWEPKTSYQAMVTLEWSSSPVQDMMSDAIIATLTKSEAEMKTSGKIATPVPIDQAVFKESLYEMLGEMFGCSCMSKMIKSSNKISLQVDDTKAVVDSSSLDVRCVTSDGKDNENLRSVISTAVNRLSDTLNPTPLEKDE